MKHADQSSLALAVANLEYAGVAVTSELLEELEDALEIVRLIDPDADHMSVLKLALEELCRRNTN